MSCARCCAFAVVPPSLSQLEHRVGRQGPHGAHARVCLCASVPHVWLATRSLSIVVFFSHPPCWAAAVRPPLLLILLPVCECFRVCLLSLASARWPLLHGGRCCATVPGCDHAHVPGCREEDAAALSCGISALVPSPSLMDLLPSSPPPKAPIVTALRVARPRRAQRRTHAHVCTRVVLIVTVIVVVLFQLRLPPVLISRGVCLRALCVCVCGARVVVDTVK